MYINTGIMTKEKKMTLYQKMLYKLNPILFTGSSNLILRKLIPFSKFNTPVTGKLFLEKIKK